MTPKCNFLNNGHTKVEILVSSFEQRGFAPEQARHPWLSWNLSLPLCVGDPPHLLLVPAASLSFKMTKAAAEACGNRAPHVVTFVACLFTLAIRARSVPSWGETQGLGCYCFSAISLMSGSGHSVSQCPSLTQPHSQPVFTHHLPHSCRRGAVQGLMNC